jgi:hypothetical protein
MAEIKQMHINKQDQPINYIDQQVIIGKNLSNQMRELANEAFSKFDPEDTYVQNKYRVPTLKGRLDVVPENVTIEYDNYDNILIDGEIKNGFCEAEERPTGDQLIVEINSNYKRINEQLFYSGMYPPIKTVISEQRLLRQNYFDLDIVEKEYVEQVLKRYRETGVVEALFISRDMKGDRQDYLAKLSASVINDGNKDYLVKMGQARYGSKELEEEYSTSKKAFVTKPAKDGSKSCGVRIAPNGVIENSCEGYNLSEVASNGYSDPKKMIKALRNANTLVQNYANPPLIDGKPAILRIYQGYDLNSKSYISMGGNLTTCPEDSLVLHGCPGAIMRSANTIS